MVTVKGIIKRRTFIVYVGVILMGMTILVQAFRVMTVQGEEWRTLAKANVPVQPVDIAPNRGDICAADGRVLATSVPFYELRFDPIAVDKRVFQEEVDSLAYCLAAFFKDRTRAQYRDYLVRARSGKHPNRYLLVNKRQVNHTELKEIRQFPIFRLGRNRGGLQAVVSDRRLQPHVNLAVRTIGYLNESETGGREGRVGLEAAFENELRGENGVGVKRMMSGTWMVVPEQEPVDGHDVVTTIDVDYQDIVQHALKAQLEKSMASHGTAVLMEVRTGDIKAIANMRRGKDGEYYEGENFAINGAGEPGSVIKAASYMALLEDGIVTPDDTINLGRGEYRFPERTLKEAHPEDWEKPREVTVREMMEKSLNGITKLVFDNYKDRPEKFVNRWHAMGLDNKTGICLPGEAEPLIKVPGDKSWSGITLPWMSFGYELKLTPLQVLAFYNAIANGGQRMRPRLVKEIRNHGSVVRTFEPEEVGGRICSRKTLQDIQDMLECVVKNGTGKNIYTGKYRIAGKTGTARIAGANGKYIDGSYRASFVGYFPADVPLFSCIVVIDNPRNGYYATTVAAPVFREIADKVYSMAYVQYGKPEYTEHDELPVCKEGLKGDFRTIFGSLGVKSEGWQDTEGTDWVITASNEGEKMVVKPRKINFSSVPNVKGMGLRDALYVLENSGLKVGVSGAGMVQKQSLRTGDEVPAGTYIQIELR